MKRNKWLNFVLMCQLLPLATVIALLGAMIDEYCFGGSPLFKQVWQFVSILFCCLYGVAVAEASKVSK